VDSIKLAFWGTEVQTSPPFQQLPLDRAESRREAGQTCGRENPWLPGPCRPHNTLKFFACASQLLFDSAKAIELFLREALTPQAQ